LQSGAGASACQPAEGRQPVDDSITSDPIGFVPSNRDAAPEAAHPAPPTPPPLAPGPRPPAPASAASLPPPRAILNDKATAI
jgi:hypothetical protein